MFRNAHLGEPMPPNNSRSCIFSISITTLHILRPEQVTICVDTLFYQFHKVLKTKFLPYQVSEAVFHNPKPIGDVIVIVVYSLIQCHTSTSGDIPSTSRITKAPQSLIDNHSASCFTIFLYHRFRLHCLLFL